jgi:hypothetical protein
MVSMADTIPRKLVLELIETNFGPDENFSPKELFDHVRKELEKQFPTVNNINHRIHAHIYHLTQAGILVKTGDATYSLSQTYPQDAKSTVSGTLYVLKDLQMGGYKIGISASIKDRLRALKVGTKAEVIGLWESHNYTDLERMLHKRYDHCRIPQSEWFALSSDELDKVIYWLNTNATQKQCNHKATVRPTINWQYILIGVCFTYLFVSIYMINQRLSELAPLIQLPLVN